MADLVWEDPPAETGSKGRLTRALRTLRDNPGRWAKIGEYAHTGTASSVRSRLVTNIKVVSEYEIVTRQKALYARFIGGETDDA